MIEKYVAHYPAIQYMYIPLSDALRHRRDVYMILLWLLDDSVWLLLARLQLNDVVSA